MIESRIEGMLRRAVESLGHVVEGRIPVERPREESHGDLASPVALMIASRARTNPAALAREIVERIDGDPDVREVSVAGPGFINFSIAEDYFRRVLREIAAEGESFGRPAAGSGRKVMVEFVSSNPTGPLTIGHGRQAALGDVVANLLEWAGHDVTREYYFNDAGRQMDLLGRSVYARYARFFDPEHPFPEDGYRGEYITEIAAGIREERGDALLGRGEEPPAETLEYMRKEAARRVVETIERDLEAFRISFDNWTRESSLIEDGTTAETLNRLRDKGAVYEKDGAVWFCATAFGEEQDRVLIKSSGDHTYFLTDIAYHVAKAKRGFDRAINLHGADHHGYVPRMKASMRALGYPDTFLEYIVHQMVTFVEGGEHLKMSTRAGTFITLRELMDKVGVDVARYFFVMIKPDSHLVFDLDLARSQSMNNPVYYLQYANARISSLFQFAAAEGYPPDLAAIAESADLGRLGEVDMPLLKALALYPASVRCAAAALEPHRLTGYLEDLSSTFHHWYEKQRVVVPDRPVTEARLYLCHSVRIILRSALRLLGVTMPDRM